MHKIAIPHGAYVLVGDGRKALFLRNEGDQKFPNLKAERVVVDENPRTSDQGSDHPGRAFARAGSHRRSGVQMTDWHELEERRFAQSIASALGRLVRQENVEAIAIVAPPQTLAELRRKIDPQVKPHVFAEIASDLTKHPVSEIERLLTS